MNTNKKSFYYILYIFLIIIISVFALGYSIAVFAILPQKTIYSEADVTGIVITKPNFSSNIWEDKLLAIKIKNIQNYLIYKKSNISLNKDEIFTVSVSGTTASLKPECMYKLQNNQSITTTSSCLETDPNKLFGTWNSYKINVGDTIKVHATLFGFNEPEKWETNDETIQKLSPQSEFMFLLIILRQNIYLFTGILLIILLIIIYWFIYRSKKNNTNSRV